LSLRLLIDEDSQAKPLVSLLRKSGHDVETANEAGLSGKEDFLVLDYARVKNRILLTQNCDDFEGEGCAVARRIPNHLVEALHRANSKHPGIFAVYQNNDRSKDMSRKELVKAIANLEVTGITLANQFISLNQWNY
jgi:predicted nuclease of predicted toxin-antitoxin system